MNRIVEVYTGAYTSGKSEISINRALMLHKEGKKVTLVDFDTVEPAYTLRPIKKEIETHGIKVITQENYMGLGETGNVITTEQQNCLFSDNDLVIDVGYGVGGLDVLEVVNGIDKEKNLNIYIVINTSKPETSKPDDIVDYINWSKGTQQYIWKKFAGIICNTHFADETTIEDVIKGYEITKIAAEQLNLPIISICVMEKLFSQIGNEYKNITVWPLKRFMPRALW